MKTTRFGMVACLALSLWVPGCADDKAADMADADDPRAAQIVTLDWSDLMPEGEEARLDRIYDDYFRDLERRMVSRQVPLASAGEVYALGAIEEGSDFDAMPQLGTFTTVERLDGLSVRLPGFIVPLDAEAQGRLQSFLFVPYFGACIHTPPPPPNQIVFVEGDPEISIEDIWQPFWAEGTMHTERVDNDLGNAAYTLTLARLYPYEE